MIAVTTRPAALNPDLDGQIVGLAAIGQTLYAITTLGYTFRSTNYGGSWQRREISQVKRFAKVGDEEAVWVDV